MATLLRALRSADGESAASSSSSSARNNGGGMSAASTSTAGTRQQPVASTSTAGVIDLTSGSSPAQGQKRRRRRGSNSNSNSGRGRMQLLTDSDDSGDSSYQEDHDDTATTRRSSKRRVTFSAASPRPTAIAGPSSRATAHRQQPAPRASTSTSTRQADLTIDDDDEDDDVVILESSAGPRQQQPPPPPQQPQGQNGVYLPGGGFRAIVNRGVANDNDSGPPRRSGRLANPAAPQPRPPVPPRDSPLDDDLVQGLAAAAGMPVADFIASQNRAIANAGRFPGPRPAPPPPIADAGNLPGRWGIRDMLDMQPGYFGNQLMDMLGDLRNLVGGARNGAIYANNNAGAGPSNNAGPRKPAKRYTQTLSHPFKDGKGFSRTIVDPADIATTTIASSASSVTSIAGSSSTRGRKKQSQIPMKAVCASCDGDLFLECEPRERPWALKCGHVVCHSCFDSAKERKQPSSSSFSKWKPVSTIPDEPIVISDDDTDDEDSTAWKKGKGKKPDKGKGKSKADETGIDEHWSECPVADCDSMGTDLLAQPGSKNGPFELFV